VALSVTLAHAVCGVWSPALSQPDSLTGRALFAALPSDQALVVPARRARLAVWRSPWWSALLAARRLWCCTTANGLNLISAAGCGYCLAVPVMAKPMAFKLCHSRCRLQCHEHTWVPP
jgi:hypothetical protein